MKEFRASLAAHWLGILASASFLSLGAPFWFNLLKRLSNLRPILAQRQERESQAQGRR